MEITLSKDLKHNRVLEVIEGRKCEKCNSSARKCELWRCSIETDIDGVLGLIEERLDRMDGSNLYLEFTIVGKEESKLGRRFKCVSISKYKEDTYGLVNPEARVCCGIQGCSDNNSSCVIYDSGKGACTSSCGQVEGSWRKISKVLRKLLENIDPENEWVTVEYNSF